jgi:hypothetical protein
MFQYSPPIQSRPQKPHLNSQKPPKPYENQDFDRSFADDSGSLPEVCHIPPDVFGCFHILFVYLQIDPNKSLAKHIQP